MHHAVYDAISVRHILRHVEAAYGDVETRLDPRPFSPFIQHLAAAAPTHQDFWKRELADLCATPFPSLPSAGYRPRPSSFIQHRVSLGLDSCPDFTVATKIQLAWALFQSQCQLADDVVFGIILSGRSAPVPGIESMTGPTIATVPRRLVLKDQDSLAELLQQTQAKQIDCLEHEHAGLQNICKWGPDAEAACAFQTLLVVQQGDAPGPALFTLTECLTGWTAFNTYALTISYRVSEPSIVDFDVSFDSHVISEQQMRRVVARFADMLQEINTSPSRPLHQVSSLSRRDHEELMAWNAEVPHTPDDFSIWDSVQHHCIHTPNSPAVCAWDGQFTYGELDSLSSDLAGLLVAKGVGPEAAVPLYFDKSRWTTVAMLAVVSRAASLFCWTHRIRFQGFRASLDAFKPRSCWYLRLVSRGRRCRRSVRTTSSSVTTIADGQTLAKAGGHRAYSPPAHSTSSLPRGRQESPRAP